MRAYGIHSITPATSLLLVKALYGARTYALVIFLAYCAYVSIRASSTNNWNHTRRLGFAEPDYCKSPGETYNVIWYNINTVAQPMNKPIMVFGAHRAELCFSTISLETCKSTMSVLDTKTSVETFTKLFHPQARNYFTYSTLFYVLSAISLSLTFLYESDESEDDVDPDSVDGHGGGAFSGHVNKRQVIRCNALIVLIIGVICIVTSVTHVFVYEEDCEDIYKATAGAKQYCQQVIACGMVVQSIITPSDSLVKEYSAVMMMWGIVLMVSTVVRWVLKSMGIVTSLQYAIMHPPIVTTTQTTTTNTITVANSPSEDNLALTAPAPNILLQVWNMILGRPSGGNGRYMETASLQTNDNTRYPTRTRPSAITNSNVSSTSTNITSGRNANRRYPISAAAVVPVTANTTVTTATTTITTVVTTTVVNSTSRYTANHRQANRLRYFSCFTPLTAEEVLSLSEMDECTVCLAPLKPSVADVESIAQRLTTNNEEVEDLEDNYRQRKQAAYHYKKKLQEIMNQDTSVQVVRTLSCQHCFHQRCLEEWIRPTTINQQAHTCPVCRSELS